MADITANSALTPNDLHNLSAVAAMIAGTNLEGWARFTALPRSISKLSAISILINCMRFLSSTKSDIAGRM